MLVVPLLYLLIGLLYGALRQQREPTRDVVSALIMILFWPMHVITSAPPVHAAIGALEAIDHWTERLRGRGPEAAELIERLLDARARVAVAMANGSSEADLRRWLAPLLEHCSKLA